MTLSVYTVTLVCMIAAALWAVLTRSLLRSAIALAVVSAVLSVLMFMLDAPLAAVFELSVCAGLITVLFISTISLTHPLTKEEVLGHMKERLRRFVWLPFIVVVIGAVLSLVVARLNLPSPGPESQPDVRMVLWKTRSLDIFGQVIILLSGVFGVVILFKEREKK